MSQPRDPVYDFIEFLQVWGGYYLEGVIMYDSRNGRFTVQMGFKINEQVVYGVKRLQIITTTGAVLTIRRKGGRDIGEYTMENGGRRTITVTRTYLPTA